MHTPALLLVPCWCRAPVPWHVPADCSSLQEALSSHQPEDICAGQSQPFPGSLKPWLTEGDLQGTLLPPCRRTVPACSPASILPVTSSSTRGCPSFLVADPSLLCH